MVAVTWSRLGGRAALSAKATRTTATRFTVGAGTLVSVVLVVLLGPAVDPAVWSATKPPSATARRRGPVGVPVTRTRVPTRWCAARWSTPVRVRKSRGRGPLEAEAGAGDPAGEVVAVHLHQVPERATAEPGVAEGGPSSAETSAASEVGVPQASETRTRAAASRAPIQSDAPA